MSSDVVEAHLLSERPDHRLFEDDRLFEAAWRNGLRSIPLEKRRGRLPGITGHIAESIVESILAGYEYTPLWHFHSNGGHGVDLLMVTPGFDGVLAIEVKGTLRSGVWPSLRTTGLSQMTPEWLASPDNAGMVEWDLEASKIYGAIFLISFADLLFKVAATADFRRVIEINDLNLLTDLKWLEGLAQ